MSKKNRWNPAGHPSPKELGYCTGSRVVDANFPDKTGVVRRVYANCIVVEDDVSHMTIQCHPEGRFRLVVHEELPPAQEIQAEISALYLRLRGIQETCSHLRATKKHGANTGNYDPSADWYWTDFTCPDCLKRWTEEGSK